MDDCIFCKMAKGDIQVQKIYEDDDVIAFPDINPIAPVHILIIPKAHLQSVLSVDDESFIISKIFRAANKIAKADDKFADGFRIVANCGENGGQSVPHLHFHLLGGRSFAWPPG